MTRWYRSFAHISVCKHILLMRINKIMAMIKRNRISQIPDFTKKVKKYECR